MQELLELLKHAEKETVFSFVAEYAAADRCFYEKLKETITPVGNNEDDGNDEEYEEYDMDAYRERADDCFHFVENYGRRRSFEYDFYEAAYRAAHEIDELLGEADSLYNDGRYTTAAGMAMSVVEVIPRHIEDVDDSDGELSSRFDDAINTLHNIMYNNAASEFIQKEIYEWSKKEVRNSIYSSYGFDGIRTIYELCCQQLGDTDEVLADIDKQIMEANEYRKSEAVLRKIRFLQSRHLDIQDVIQTHIDLTEVRKIRFNQLTDNRQFDEALELAKQGIAIAEQKNHPGTILDWKKAMYDVYLANGDTGNLLQMAEYMYLHPGYRFTKDEFYNVLKKYTPKNEWLDTMERLLASAEKASGFDSFAARIMHEHQLWPRLFSHCKRGNIGNLEKYDNDLKPFFEKEILEFYLSYVEKQALITDSHAYDEVARMLKRMRTFTGGNDLVNKLLEHYRISYKRRKNMVAALRDV